jgi:hypothetical protein
MVSMPGGHARAKRVGHSFHPFLLAFTVDLLHHRSDMSKQATIQVILEGVKCAAHVFLGYSCELG